MTEFEKIQTKMWFLAQQQVGEKYIKQQTRTSWIKLLCLINIKQN